MLFSKVDDRSSSMQTKETPIQSAGTNQLKEITNKTRTKVDWTHVDNVLTVTMATESVSLNEWRAIGFSLDEEMVILTDPSQPDTMAPRLNILG